MDISTVYPKPDIHNTWIYPWISISTASLCLSPPVVNTPESYCKNKMVQVLPHGVKGVRMERW